MEVRDDGAVVLFTVRDTGIGIPHDKLPELFAPFTQVDSSTTRAYGGTGLGLAISKQLVEMMDGSIHIESEEGRGTVFTFSLPLPKANHQSAASAPTAGGQKLSEKEMTILLVEDDLTVRDVISMSLRERGWKVLSALNGQSALELWQREPVDLILMDLQMPGMSGLEVTRNIREMETVTGKRTPIIALTAHARKEDEERCCQAGMDGFLTKPVKIQWLYTAVEKILP